MKWDYTNPFIKNITVDESHIDGLGHVNNKVYLDWIIDTAWAHSTSLGFGMNEYTQLGYAMVARQHELNYLAATFLGDQLLIGTWITMTDNKFKSRREYQIIRESDEKTVFRATTNWLCINIENGKLAQMPTAFIEAYKPTNV